MMYFDRLRRAEKFTREIGLEAPRVRWVRNRRYLGNDVRLSKLFRRIERDIGIKKPGDIVAKCNVVAHGVALVASRVFRCDAYVTIGQVWTPTEISFEMNEKSVRELIARGKEGLVPGTYKHHAWVTLDSMEIIDLVLPISIEVAQGRVRPDDTRPFAVIAKHADEFVGMRLDPVMVGDSFYRTYERWYLELMRRFLPPWAAAPRNDGAASSVPT